MPFIIYDTINEYGEVENVQTVNDVQSLIDAIEMEENIRVIGERGEISFPELTEIIATAVRNYTFLVDEFHLLYDNFQTFKKENPFFRELVLLGRHSGIGLILTSQRATHIPVDALSQATKLFVFNVFRKEDIKFLGLVVNNAEMFATLGTFEYFEIDLTISPPSATKKKLQISFDKPEQSR